MIVMILPNWFPHGEIILAKGQLNHSYTFWFMSILIFSPVPNLSVHPLADWLEGRSFLKLLFIHLMRPLRSSTKMSRRQFSLLLLLFQCYHVTSYKLEIWKKPVKFCERNSDLGNRDLSFRIKVSAAIIQNKTIGSFHLTKYKLQIHTCQTF